MSRLPSRQSCSSCPYYQHTGFLRTNPLTPSTSSLRVALIKQPCTPSFGIHPFEGSISLVKSSLCPYESNRSASSTAKKQRLARLIVLDSSNASSLVGVEMITSGASLRSDLPVSFWLTEGAIELTLIRTIRPKRH
jgi:hypothetical protein